MASLGSLWAPLSIVLCSVWLCKGHSKEQLLQSDLSSHSSKHLSQRQGTRVLVVEVTLQKCISCFTWTIFTRFLDPPGFWNTPSIPCTRIFIKPWQVVLQPKLFPKDTCWVLLWSLQPQCRNEPHVWVQILKNHPKGRSGPCDMKNLSLLEERVKLPCPPALPTIFRGAVYHPTWQPRWPQTLAGAHEEVREQG